MDIYEIRKLRLRLLIADEYKGNQAEFSRVTGIKSPQINRWLSETAEDKRNITEPSARNIEKRAKKPTGWLDGKGDQSARQPPGEYGNIRETIPLRGRVPLISGVAAGNWSEAVDNFSPNDAAEWIETTVPVKQHTYALKVSGDSMVDTSGSPGTPSFPDGMVIIVEPEMEPMVNDFVIVKNGDGEPNFKQLIRDGGEWYLRPLNDRYPIKPLGQNKVIGVVREARHIFR